MLAAKERITDGSRQELIALSLADFKKASELHHLDPTNFLNLASTLRLLGMNEEAELFYHRAVELQGSMETAFNANHWLADFLLQKSVAEYSRNDLPSAITTLEIAARHIDSAMKLGGGWSLGTEGDNLEVRIYLSLGQALEAAGNPQRALMQYDHASGLRLGQSAHYLAALLLGKQAAIAWAERGAEEDALRLFLEANERIVKANPPPEGVTQESRDEYTEYLLKSIRYLQDTNVKPSEKIDF